MNAYKECIPPPKKKCFAVLVYGRGQGCNNRPRGRGLGPGSAARSISSTGTRESVKIGIFSGGQYHYCHTLITAIAANGPCVDLFGLRTC